MPKALYRRKWRGGSTWRNTSSGRHSVALHSSAGSAGNSQNAAAAPSAHQASPARRPALPARHASAPCDRNIAGNKGAANCAGHA
ncbi:hypothetical protein D3C72_1788460 [compost metagenome]